MLLTAATIGKPLATAIGKKFGATVIERWTRHRAEAFFNGFVETLGTELTNGVQTEEVDKRLTAILADEKNSEVLFDSYRRVCFTKSKRLGPRIIGLLTGQVVNEGRMAHLGEEQVFAAAELLSDGEFIEFMKTYHEYRMKAEGTTSRKNEVRMLHDSIIIRWNEASWKLGGFPREVELGSLPWLEALGCWAVGLAKCGLLEYRIQQEPETVRGPKGENMVVKTTTTVTFDSSCKQLYDLLSRSLGPETRHQDAPA